jgi:hypothetical protein
MQRFTLHRVRGTAYWMPAFAGMTIERRTMTAPFPARVSRKAPFCDRALNAGGRGRD